jgi:hypothetical protein
MGTVQYQEQRWGFYGWGVGGRGAGVTECFVIIKNLVLTASNFSRTKAKKYSDILFCYV